MSRQPSLFTLVRAKVSRDDISLRASGLAYSTLASLVPLFAILLTVLSGNAFKDKREEILDQLAARLVPASSEAPTWLQHIDPELADAGDRLMQEKFEQEQIDQDEFKRSFRERIETFAERAVEVSLFGFLVLCVIVWMLFRSIERTFNAIWGAANHRSILVRIGIAAGIIVGMPVMFAISISLSHLLKEWPVFGNYLLPALLTAFLFTALFVMLPHARVQFKAAVIAAATTALAWEFVKLLFLLYVTHVVNYPRVYGALGLIPMLFLWVYLNWLVILVGAVLAYCLQHRTELSAAFPNPAK